MKYHDEFFWDPEKATANRKKHGVTFDDAAAVLGDDRADVFHVEEHDDANSVAEDRYLTTGSHPADRRVILKVCWTDRSTETARITRIISARLVTRREGNEYAEEVKGQ